MHPFQRKALERFCREHGLDIKLIDDTLTFEENKRILQSLTIKTAEELVIWARTLEDMERNTQLADAYGLPYDFKAETPLVLIKVFVKFSRNRVRLFQNRVKPFSKHVKRVMESYYLIEGQPSEVAKILSQVEDLKPRILRIFKKFDVNFQYIAGIGWIRKDA